MYRWRRAGSIRFAGARFASNRENVRAPVRVPALIVGAGPVGLYLSTLLSRFGVRSILVERDATLADHPKAHLINTRSMELFREFGLDDQIHAAAPPRNQWASFQYCTSLQGQEVGNINHLGGSAFQEMLEQSPTALSHLSQPKLVKILLRAARQEAAPLGSSVLYSYNFLDFREQGSQVVATVHQDKHHQPIRVECDHLIATDGAGSQIRSACDLPQERLHEEDVLQKFVSVHFRSKAMGRLALKQPAMLYFVFNPEVICVLVAHNLEQGEWVAQLPFYPPAQQLADFTPQLVRRMLLACAGHAPQVGQDLEVVSVRGWTMAAQVATHFTKGRVHLVGDAAHQFPPSGAFGMNTGLQDAHNLAWKLALVHHGKADASLLQSYSAERRPVAVHNGNVSVSNFRRGLLVPRALGLRPELADGISNIFKTGPASLLPIDLQRHTMDSTLAVGRQTLRLPGGPNNPLNHLWLQGARRVVAKGQALPMIFPEVELGMCYDRPGAVVVASPQGNAGSKGVGSKGVDSNGMGSNGPGHATGRTTTGVSPRTRGGSSGGSNHGGTHGDPALYNVGRYHPRVGVGMRLPHAWLEDGGRSVSTLDLLRPEAIREATPSDGSNRGLPPFLLLTQGGHEAGRWCRAGARLAEDWGLHIRLAMLTHPSQGSHLPIESPPETLLLQDLNDCFASWQLQGCGAVLVRPDGHVAWHATSSAQKEVPSETEAYATLQHIFESMLQNKSMCRPRHVTQDHDPIEAQT